MFRFSRSITNHRGKCKGSEHVYIIINRELNVAYNMDNHCVNFPTKNERHYQEAWREVNRITNNSITVARIITTNTDYILRGRRRSVTRFVPRSLQLASVLAANFVTDEANFRKFHCS